MNYELDMERYKHRKIKNMYEELCEMIRGDSPNWTHEEVVEKLELAMDCLIFVENEVDHKEFIDWNIQNKKESEYDN